VITAGVLAAALAVISPASARTLEPAQPSGPPTVTDFGGGSDKASAVAIQPDGRIVAAGRSLVRVSGSAHSYFALARYLPDGSLDPSFGAGGRVDTDAGSDEEGAYDVVALPDGRIVAAGAGGRTFENERMTAARYLPDGSPDPSFGGGDGVADVTGVEYWGHDCLYAQAAAAQPDGKLVLVGSVGCGGEEGGVAIAVVRLLPDGRLDPSFDRDGTQTFDFGPCDYGTAVALQPDGKILVAGTDGGCYEEKGPFRVARLNPDGSFDRGFGRRGRQRVDFVVPLAALNDIQLDARGRILLIGGAVGHTRRGGRHLPATFALARLTATGALDRSFGHRGVIRGPFSLRRSSFAGAAAVLSDGRIMAVGTVAWGTRTSRVLVAAYRPDGQISPSVGTRGLRLVHFGGTREEAGAVAVDPSGGLFVAGSTRRPGTSWDFGMARLSTH
jgi:uncharacterized delta-60 repeat protein